MARTPEQRFLERYDFAGRTCVDAGGNDGRTAWYFARQARRVVTFEPNPHSQVLIAALVRRNRCMNIELVPAALGEMRGETTLITHSDRADGEGTFDHTIGASFGETFLRTVPMTTLDDYCSANTIRPDFVKVDVEGFELQVLRGAEEVTAAFHPDFFIEIHGEPREAKIANVLGVLTWLQQRGYKCLHVESGSAATPATADEACKGHIFATLSGAPSS